jgi:hypothetical protein
LHERRARKRKGSRQGVKEHLEPCCRAEFSSHILFAVPCNVFGEKVFVRTVYHEMFEQLETMSIRMHGWMDAETDQTQR